MKMTPTNNWICQNCAGEGTAGGRGCHTKRDVSNGEGKMGKRKGFGIPGPGCVWVVERTLPCYSNYMDQGPRSPRD